MSRRWPFRRGTIEIVIACALTLAALVYMAFTAKGNGSQANGDRSAVERSEPNPSFAHR